MIILNYKILHIFNNKLIIHHYYIDYHLLNNYIHYLNQI